MDLRDPERERVDRSDQVVVGWALLAATIFALVFSLRDVARSLGRPGAAPDGYGLEIVVFALSPWLLWLGGRLARGHYARRALFPPWGLVLVGAGLLALAPVLQRWAPPGDLRLLSFLLPLGVGALTLGLQRWWRARASTPSRGDGA
jgi:hypothetical protein